MKPAFQLVTENIPGNLHAAASYINKFGLADYVIALDYSGRATIAVYRVPAKLAPRLREWMNILPEHRENPPLSKDAPFRNQAGGA